MRASSCQGDDHHRDPDAGTDGCAIGRPGRGRCPEDEGKQQHQGDQYRPGRTRPGIAGLGMGLDASGHPQETRHQERGGDRRDGDGARHPAPVGALDQWLDAVFGDRPAGQGRARQGQGQEHQSAQHQGLCER